PQTHDEIAELVLAYNKMIENMRERKIIDDLSKKLSSTFRLEDLISIINKQLKEAINAGSIKLFIPEQNSANTFRKVADKSSHDFGSLTIDDYSTLDFLSDHSDGFILNDAPDSVQMTFKQFSARRTDLIVPMIRNGKIIGILLFNLPEEREKYSDEEQHFALSLSSPLGLALENTLLYDELRDQERMKRELEIARDIQQKLLPKSMPQIKGFDIEGFCHPATEVGGDYFDFFELKDSKLGVVIADVSGKGTSASFYMAQLKGMMMQSAIMYDSPKKFLIELNRKIYASLDRNLFITMIYGILDTKKKELLISRAGHNALIHIKNDNSHTTFTPSGIGLGLDSGKVFKKELNEIRIILKTQDTLLFYTDGIIEAMKPDGEEFGEERLLNALIQSKLSNISEKRKNIQTQLETFLIGNKPQDDITMILIDCNF
ncbi:MAG: SpoIIE family protein phosphatase, partial [Calditrichaceae bacterium]